MAKEIMVTPEALRAQARQVRALGDADRNTIRRLTNLVQTLTVAWNGPSQVAFVEKYMSMQPTVESFHKAIEDFAKLMDEHAGRMESTDRNLAIKISGLLESMPGHGPNCR